MARMSVAVIGLGANLPSAWGAPRATIAEGVRRLEALGRVVRMSSLRETEPVGYLEQPLFLNGALVLETELGPAALLQGMLLIEQQAGRVREHVAQKGPRVLDLDLLLYDEMVLLGEELTVPHPALHERLFVLDPMEEIVPAMRHPVLGKTVHALWVEAEDRLQIELGGGRAEMGADRVERRRRGTV